MKRLHEKVNVIPLIAKADTLTPEESQQFKKQVRGPAHEGLPSSASLVDGEFVFVFFKERLKVFPPPAADHAGNSRAQDQDLRVPRDGRRGGEQAGEED